MIEDLLLFVETSNGSCCLANSWCSPGETTVPRTCAIHTAVVECHVEKALRTAAVVYAHSQGQLMATLKTWS